jgi:hypothetical protein
MTIKKIAVLVTFMFLFAFPVFCQKWILGIQPLKDKISEIEELRNLQKTMVRDDKIRFKLDQGNLFIGISIGRCQYTSWGMWNVDDGTILNVIFYPKPRHGPSPMASNRILALNQESIIHFSLTE